MSLQHSDVLRAIEQTPWDFSNQILYRLCREFPLHIEQDVVLTKILMIGRIYAAAIERRRKKGNEKNDDFYIKAVGPRIVQSDMDVWISEAKKVSPGTPAGWTTLLRVHLEVTKLFRRISKQNKRSLASKYRHFHVPSLFFILDSRALAGMRSLSYIVGQASHENRDGDDEYRKFTQKCLRLQVFCVETFGVELNPRQLDNLLLRQALS
ncbi:MAG TPA: hypothetical protein VHB46_01775 [Burkholderiales bacterium]|nr:hypothetical protein [Burkholderiales bacterium]